MDLEEHLEGRRLDDVFVMVTQGPGTGLERAYPSGPADGNIWVRCMVDRLRRLPEIEQGIFWLGADLVAAVFTLSTSGPSQGVRYRKAATRQSQLSTVQYAPSE